MRWLELEISVMNFDLGYIDETQWSGYEEHASFFKTLGKLENEEMQAIKNCGQEKHLLAATYSENNLSDSYRVYLS